MPRRIVTTILLAAVAAAAIAAFFDTLPDLGSGARLAVEWASAIATIVFVVEYLLRLWTAAEQEHRRVGGGAARLRAVVPRHR